MLRITISGIVAPKDLRVAGILEEEFSSLQPLKDQSFLRKQNLCSWAVCPVQFIFPGVSKTSLEGSLAQQKSNSTHLVHAHLAHTLCTRTTIFATIEQVWIIFVKWNYGPNAIRCYFRPELKSGGTDASCRQSEPVCRRWAVGSWQIWEETA